MISRDINDVMSSVFLLPLPPPPSAAELRELTVFVACTTAEIYEGINEGVIAVMGIGGGRGGSGDDNVADADADDEEGCEPVPVCTGA